MNALGVISVNNNNNNNKNNNNNSSNNNSVKKEWVPKFKQVNQFVELILPRFLKMEAGRDLSVVDVGCGRGILTGAVHEQLIKSGHFKSVQSVGIDSRVEVLSNAKKAAAEVEGLEGLTFEAGGVEDWIVSRKEKGAGLLLSKETSLAVIALHCCDTGSDRAISMAVKEDADVIVLSPCCHKEVRAQLKSSATGDDHALRSSLKYGIYQGQIAEIVTDTLRALFLELHGYDVDVFEFCGAQVTAKNTMITAVKKKGVEGEEERVTQRERVRKEIRKLMAAHGIETFQLAKDLGWDEVG